MKKRQLLYCGCEPSRMDGSEHIVNVDNKLVIPEEFSWRYVMPPVRNQGTAQTCVCQTLTGMLDFCCNSVAGTPNKCNKFSIQELYNCRANKRVEGMTIKEALHYLRHNGLNGQHINNYAKITNIESLKRSLLMFGPVAGGLRCYDGDPEHFWRRCGRFCGGHCITFVGYTKDGIIIRNSWGTSWGDGGYNVMPDNEFMDACFESWTFAL